MKLVLVVLFAFIVVAFAQTRPTWPKAFSATVETRVNGRRPEFLR